MNLSEVLNVALPELPARRIGKEVPQLHPKIIAREHVEGGVPVVVAMVSGNPMVLRFAPETWALVELFDGQRSYKEIARVYQEQTGVEYTEEQVREYAADLDESGFFYKTALELNVTAVQKLTDQRHRRTKRKVDLALISFPAWNPDSFLTKLHDAVGFIYTKWFTLLALVMFAIMTSIFVGGWHEIWRDTIQYYDFTDKGAWDLAEFWLLFCTLGFFHESAHGLTCKHFGGAVYQMGFMLIYLSPAFYCDIGEVYVYGGKWPRIAAIIAGIWVELLFCSIASILWWGTPAGSPVHDFTYKVMLITGVGVILLNLNPLMKLDGYYLLGEVAGVSNLKERSTEYLSGWVKRSLGLPVEVPYLRRQRRWLFVGYALLSGLYSYLVLFATIRFSYNVSSRFSPQWAFLPAFVLAVLILRSRLRSSWRFMRDFYLDKRQMVHGWWSMRRKTLAAAFVLLVLFAPVWRDTVGARFVLEPGQRAVIRATVPGQVTEVFADEGAPIAAGAPVLRLRNVSLEEDADRSQSDLRTAEADARRAQLDFTDLGRARGERASQSARDRSVSQQVAALQLLSPIAGLVVTPRIQNLVGSFVQEGAELAEIDNVKTLQARIFIPEFQIDRVALGAAVSLKLESFFRPIRGQVSAIMPASSAIAAGLLHEKQYQGTASPKYYLATVLVPNSDGRLHPGLSGDAKIRAVRRSLVGFMEKNIREFVQRKLW